MSFIGAVVKYKYGIYAKEPQLFKVIDIMHDKKMEVHKIILESASGLGENRIVNHSDRIGSLTWDEAFFDSYEMHDDSRITNQKISEKHLGFRFDMGDIVTYDNKFYVVVFDESNNFPLFREMTTGIVTRGYEIETHGKKIK